MPGLIFFQSMCSYYGVFCLENSIVYKNAEKMSNHKEIFFRLGLLCSLVPTCKRVGPTIRRVISKIERPKFDSSKFERSKAERSKQK